MVEFLNELARKGHHIDRAVSVVDARATVDSESSGTVFLTLKQSRGQVLDRDGTVVERLPASTDRVVLDFLIVEGDLVVAQIGTNR